MNYGLYVLYSKLGNFGNKKATRSMLANERLKYMSGSGHVLLSDLCGFRLFDYRSGGGSGSDRTHEQD